MSRNAHVGVTIRCLAACSFVFVGLLAATSAEAAQIDIAGPSGSAAFGAAVAVLPNGNIVVTDPNYSSGTSNVGAVYLYTPAGVLIDYIFGSTANDHVGSGGITVLKNGNFVVSSPTWYNAVTGFANAGAVTWVDGSVGLSGTVADTNSLVGTQSDGVGANGVVALSNGNYVVNSANWNYAGTPKAGAVTWVNGTTGSPRGAVADTNSLIGSTANDYVGIDGVRALANGNYVVISTSFTNTATAASGAGAVTWADGSVGLTGPVLNATTSLLGTSTNDFVGQRGVVELSNGNYVVSSSSWHNGATANAGAVTWVNGSTGLSSTGAAAHFVSFNNSLVGDKDGDSVGLIGVTALSNGNYVVGSSQWGDGTNAVVGAVTWADGSTGLSAAVVSASNSLVGSTTNDNVGLGGNTGFGVTALSNGNYVVNSSHWTNSAASAPFAGAVTMGNGATGSLVGTVSSANSLVGTHVNDSVGSSGVTALSNGNFVVSSPYWNGVAANGGAATWVSGSSGLTGAVSTANSLYGTQASDQVSADGVVALGNGNYVVASSAWANTTNANAGAATWGNGSTGLTGTISSANSLVGTTSGDIIGYGTVGLSNGSYAVLGYNWTNGLSAQVGAVTWASGKTGLDGTCSATNSLVGNNAGDEIGSNGITPLSNGSYVVSSPYFANGLLTNAGAISLGRGHGGTVGNILDTNSVRGKVSNESMVFAYDATRDTLVVGQQVANIVSLFKADLLFKNGFE